jgi:hypothetical protein
MAPDPTWYNLTNFVPDRLDVIADEIDVLGSAVMGLTLKCARCHTHKFDPIPHRDYHRLLAVFKGAFDEHDWMKSNWHGTLSMGARTDRDAPYVSTAERRAWEAKCGELDGQIAALRAGAGSGEPSEEAKKQIASLEAQRPPEPKIRALWDRGDPSPTYIYRRGDYLTPGREVGPGVPSVLTDGKTPFDVQPPWPGAKQTGRRLAFARWLTRPDHPLTARVLVNRLWGRHFGAGLVATYDNFGKAGAAPTHPELLDWLAIELVRSGWSLKAMHRRMTTSATYRQSSKVDPAAARVDPAGAWLSRMPMQRLSAEQLYDAFLSVAGRLDATPFGPADQVDVRPDGLVTPRGTDRGWRRAIYVQQQRKVIVTHFEAFDFPQMNPNCIARRDSTVAPQALHLMNDGLVRQLSDSFARRVAAEAGANLDARVELVQLAAWGRPATEADRQAGREALETLEAAWKQQAAASEPPERAAQAALETYCHAVLNSAEFIYVD